MTAVLAFPAPMTESMTAGLLKKTGDLADLSDQQIASLSVCVTQFRLSQQRLGHELFALASTLVRMKDILGSRFGKFVEDELNISVRTANRYLHIHTVLQTHFSSNGLINVAQASQLTQNALRLLSPDTPEDVIGEIRELADKGGKKIDEATIRQILESRERDLEAALASAQAEQLATVEELKKARSQSELHQARMQNELDKSEELLRRAALQRDALEAEIEELQKKATIVTEKEVIKEVPPAGYSSAIDAVNAANQMLVEAQTKKKKLEDEIAAANRRHEELKAQVAELEAGEAEFLKLKGMLEDVLVKYPLARLKAMTAIDSNIKNVMHGIGQTMAELGQQLQLASAKK